MSTAKPGVPIACTLDGAAVGERLADWQALREHASSRTRSSDGTLRIEFGPDLPLAGLAELVAAEHGCCAFLSFAITVDHRGVGLEVTAPEGADDMVMALFGA